MKGMVENNILPLIEMTDSGIPTTLTALALAPLMKCLPFIFVSLQENHVSSEDDKFNFQTVRSHYVLALVEPGNISNLQKLEYQRERVV